MGMIIIMRRRIIKNHIGNEGASILAEALRTNNTLHTINLSGNQIKDEGAESIAQALRENNTIRTINLDGNEIGNEGATSFSKTLLVNNSIDTIELNKNCSISENYLLIIKNILKAKKNDFNLQSYIMNYPLEKDHKQEDNLCTDLNSSKNIIKKEAVRWEWTSEARTAAKTVDGILLTLFLRELQKE